MRTPNRSPLPSTPALAAGWTRPAAALAILIALLQTGTTASAAAAAADRQSTSRTRSDLRLAAAADPGEQIQELMRQARERQANGDLAGATRALERIVVILEEALGQEHPYTANAYNNLARQYESEGRYKQAEALFRRALKIQLEKQGPSHPETITTTGNLAECYRKQGRYAESEALNKRAISDYEKTLGSTHLDTAIAYNNLAVLYDDQGRFAEAEALYNQVLAIFEKQLGAEHPDTALTLSNLGSTYISQGRYIEAERAFRRTLEIREKNRPANPINIANSLNNLGEAIRAQGHAAEAVPLYGRALAISEQALGESHPLTAAILSNLGLTNLDLNRYQDAEHSLKRSLQIKQTTLGENHPDTALGHENLAGLSLRLLRFEDAEIQFRQALKIREATLGTTHPQTARSLNNLALVALLQSRVSVAEPLLGRLSQAQSDWLRRELPLQPRELRMAQLQAQPDGVASTFALLDQDPSSAPLALETRLNRQGLLAEIEQRQRLLASSSPENRTLASQLAALDRQLASITLSAAQRQQLQTQRQELEGDLNRQLPALGLEPVGTDQVAAVLKSLAPQGLLVEFQKYRPYQRGDTEPGRWGAPRYIALLLDPKGRITAVQLGEAAPIDQAIGRALAASATDRPEAFELWKQVSTLVLTPLEPQLRNVRELFLSPDGGLHRVPFAALPAPGGSSKLLNEAYQLRLLTTGRDLVRLQRPSRTGGSAVLVANPAYDSLRHAAHDPIPSRGSRAPLNAVSSMPSDPQLRSGALTSATRWAPLPGTAQEAKVLAPLLGVSRPITGTDARAPVVLQQEGPLILHIATHGFFQPDQPAPPPDPLAYSRGAAPIRREDPLLRSGLVMAGANNPDADPTDDGYLTAAEVTGMDLNGTQLVTLSACQSGLGDLQTGEGVYGLQRALSVAGARSTLLSLWNVDDAGTRAFMEALYGRLLRGESRSDALARTQADFRVHANSSYRSPFVWAAFQLSGDWRPIRSDSAAPPER